MSRDPSKVVQGLVWVVGEHLKSSIILHRKPEREVLGRQCSRIYGAKGFIVTSPPPPGNRIRFCEGRGGGQQISAF